MSHGHMKVHIRSQTTEQVCTSNVAGTCFALSYMYLVQDEKIQMFQIMYKQIHLLLNALRGSYKKHHLDSDNNPFIKMLQLCSSDQLNIHPTQSKSFQTIILHQ